MKIDKFKYYKLIDIMGLLSNESGVGLLIGMLLNLAFFIGVPIIAESYWPTFMRLKEDLKLDIYPYMVAHVTLF